MVGRVGYDPRGHGFNTCFLETSQSQNCHSKIYSVSGTQRENGGFEITTVILLSFDKHILGTNTIWQKHQTRASANLSHRRSTSTVPLYLWFQFQVKGN